MQSRQGSLVGDKSISIEFAKAQKKRPRDETQFSTRDSNPTRPPRSSKDEFRVVDSVNTQVGYSYGFIAVLSLGALAWGISCDLQHLTILNIQG